LIGKARKSKNKNDVCDGLEGSDNGKNKVIRKCLGIWGRWGVRKTWRRISGNKTNFRPTHLDFGSPFVFVLDDVVSGGGVTTEEFLQQ
jgi:hypothetical protein